MDEMTLLIDVKAPNITAYFHSYQFYKTSSPDINKALEPTLNIFVEQWQRGERQIDTSLLILRCPVPTRIRDDHQTQWMDWKVINPAICGLPGKLCNNQPEAHRIDWINNDAEGFWLIRRGPNCREGLLVGVKGSSILLISCDYEFRRTRTHEETAASFAATELAQKKIKAAFAGDEPEKVIRVRRMVRRTRRTISDRFAARDRAENALKEWKQHEIYNSIPVRELAIDRLPTVEFDPPKDRLIGAYSPIC